MSQYPGLFCHFRSLNHNNEHHILPFSVNFWFRVYLRGRNYISNHSPRFEWLCVYVRKQYKKSLIYSKVHILCTVEWHKLGTMCQISLSFSVNRRFKVLQWDQLNPKKLYFYFLYWIFFSNFQPKSILN